MKASLLALLMLLIRRLFGPARPASPTVQLFLTPRSPTMADEQFNATITPSTVADSTIVKTSVTPIINGTPGTPIDTAGPAITVPVKLADTVSSTETVTNAAGLTSDPSDPSPTITVVDPRPAKPAPPTIAVTLAPPAPAAQ